MSEQLVRSAVEAVLAVDQVYWLGARVEAAKIIFFGFFRTEEDALDAVTSPPP